MKNSNTTKKTIWLNKNTQISVQENFPKVKYYLKLFKNRVLCVSDNIKYKLSTLRYIRYLYWILNIQNNFKQNNQLIHKKILANFQIFLYFYLVSKIEKSMYNPHSFIYTHRKKRNILIYNFGFWVIPDSAQDFSWPSSQESLLEWLRRPYGVPRSNLGQLHARQTFLSDTAIFLEVSKYLI